MLLCEYVRDNMAEIKLRYGKIRSWDNEFGKGQQTNFPNIWEKGRRCRLYIPISTSGSAGYIDLVKHTVHPEVNINTYSSEENRELLQTILDELLTKINES